MRKTWDMVGTSASTMPGTRWARSTSFISCNMSRSSLMPASSSQMAVLTPIFSK